MPSHSTGGERRRDIRFKGGARALDEHAAADLEIDRDNVRYVALADLDAIDDKIKRDAGALSVVDLSRRKQPAG